MPPGAPPWRSGTIAPGAIPKTVTGTQRSTGARHRGVQWTYRPESAGASCVPVVPPPLAGPASGPRAPRAVGAARRPRATGRGWRMAQPLGRSGRLLRQVREGMVVYDRHRAHVGTVAAVYLGGAD